MTTMQSYTPIHYMNAYETVSQAVCNVRMCQPLANDWEKNIEEDFEERRK